MTATSLASNPLLRAGNGHYVAAVVVQTKGHTVEGLLAYVNFDMEKTSMATLSTGWSGTGVHWASCVMFW